MKVFTVEEPVFKTEPLFVVVCSHEALASYLKHRFHVTTDPAFELAGQMLTFHRPPWRVVWVKRDGDLAVALHEVFHLVTRICQDKGVSIVAHHQNGENGDEAAAHLFEFFAKAVIRRMK